MFASHEVELSMSFARARAKLMTLLSQGEWLSGPSGRAYAEGLDSLIRVGPFGAVLGASKLVRVQLLEPVPREDTVVLPLRWEATGTAGRLFPVLDANLVLTPRDADRSTLALIGAYRPPLGGVGAVLDRALLHRAATATIRSLVYQAADSVVAGETAPGLASVMEPAGPEPARWQAEPGASA
jgi:hypothetical protein